MDQRVKSIKAWRVNYEEAKLFEDNIIKEVPLTIFLNGQEIVTLLSTPEYLDELAVGFLVSEGMIANLRDIVKLTVDPIKGTVWVEAKSNPIAEQLYIKRYITTGCGKGTTFYNVMDAKKLKGFNSDIEISTVNIFSLMKEFQKNSELFINTGGVHSTALCDKENILIFREDIGRHNATDKIVGHCFLNEISLEGKFLMTSGRISSEILIKSAKLGLGLIVSRSAPTSLSVEIAEELGVTIVGFVRGGRMNVYTNPQRVIEQAGELI